MPTPSTVDEFLDLASKSGVLDKQSLDAYLEKQGGAAAVADRPIKLAKALVREGLLTHFQAEQLLQGKNRGFIINDKYVLLEKLGSGGMGSVYLCEHKKMRHRVAIKVLPADKAKDPGSLERFEREGRAAAALNHPNIARAYDIDQSGKMHFLVMEHIDGASLQEIVKTHGPMDVLRAGHYIAQAALGLQHAHEAGLVHRDIKPGNLLLDRLGTVKILDMGLARFFRDEKDNLTQEYDSTSVLGTADYLAPEQAMNSHTADIRADIYSLGVTFYCLLTGNAPFSEGSVAEKLIWHQMRQPKPIRDIRPEVPEEMAAIINQMMAKDLAQRYQTPVEIYQALTPWLHTPIPPPPDEEMPRLSPGASRSSPSDTKLVRSALTPVTMYPVKPNHAGPQGPATRKLQKSDTGVPVSLFKPDKQDSASGSTDSVSTLAIALAPTPAGPPAVVGWQRWQIWLIVSAVSLMATVTMSAVVWMAVRPAAPVTPTIVVAPPIPPAPVAAQPKPPPPAPPAAPATAKPLDPKPAPTVAKPLDPKPAPGEIRRFLGHTDAIHRVAISPDGRYGLSAAFDAKPLRLWDVTTGQEVRSFDGHTSGGYWVNFSPDSRRAVSGSRDQTARVWEVATGRELACLRGHTHEVRSVVFAPDGRYVLSGSNDKTVRLWDAETGKEVRRFEGHTGAVYGVAISPDGRQALSAGAEPAVRLWDVATGNESRRFEGHDPTVGAVAFSPDGRLAASVGLSDKTARIWEVTTGRELRSLKGHEDSLHYVDFSPDGRYLLTSGGGRDPTIRLWEVESGKEAQAFRGHAATVGAAVFSPDGRTALSGGFDKTLRLWQLPEAVFPKSIPAKKPVAKIDIPDKPPTPKTKTPAKSPVTKADDAASTYWKGWRDRQRVELATLPKPSAPPEGTGQPIDRFLSAHWAKHRFTPPPPVDDRTFARRVYLDLVGLLPTIEQLERFERDAAPEKRQKLVDALLADKEGYAEHWMSFWNDLLRNDEQTNIDNLRKPITTWLYPSLRDNKPLDLFVAELLNPFSLPSPSGGEGRVRGDVPDGYLKGVNWRGVVNASQTPPIQAAQNVSQVFLASSLKCASCHDSFINEWKLEQAYGLASFFAPQNLEMHRCDKSIGKTVPPKFLFAGLGEVAATANPAERHQAVAQMVTRPKNPRFAKTIVNRLWKRLLGRGLFEPVDDFDSEPPNSDLLDWLAHDFMSHDYDAKHTLRLIALSRVYQLPVAKERPGERGVLTPRSKEVPPLLGPAERRLASEQYLDAVAQVTGHWPKVPTMNVPVANPHVRAWRHKKPEPLAVALGRPNREQVCTERNQEATVLQALELVNGSVLSGRLKEGTKTLLASDLGREADTAKLVQALYRRAVGRLPSAEEVDLAKPLLGSPKEKSDTRQPGWEDFLWVLFQDPEFQFVR